MTVFRICFIIRLFLKYLGWGDVFRRWFLPCWVVGAAASFALPVVPHWLFWLAAFAVFAVFAGRFAFAGLMLCVLAGAAYGVFRTEAALSSQWWAEAVSGVPLTVEVADMPRSDGRRVQFAAKAVDSGGRTFDLLLSDYKRREWAVGSRWRITARVHPVVGELNLRGLNREAWALSNGIGGVGTVGADRVLLLLLPRGLGLRPWAVLLLAGFVFYRPPGVPENEVAVTVWDAGQGLSVSVQTANHHLLFDTGTAAAAQMGIVPSLNAAGVRRLDKLVLSHHDSDHDGGFQAVGKIPNGGIYARQPEFYEGARHCAEQRWQWDGVDFEFLMPSERKNIDDNGKSCVLRVVAGGAALLVTGDLDTKGEESLVGKYGGNLYSQVLVLGHHGSNTSSSGVFLNAVSPEYAVASSGYANAYKHPTEAVQNRVRAHGIKLLRTDLSGALQFGLGRGGVKAQRLRGYKFYWQKKPFE